MPGSFLESKGGSLFQSAEAREAIEANDAAAARRFDHYKRQFGELAKYETAKFGNAASDSEKIRAMLNMDLPST